HLKTSLYLLFLAGLIACLSGPRALSETNVLFVGNSFTYGHVDPVLHYNHSAITDANGHSYGGVPGIFKKLATQAGFACNVTSETEGGQTRPFHCGKNSATIGQPQ